MKFIMFLCILDTACIIHATRIMFRGSIHVTRVCVGIPQLSIVANTLLVMVIWQVLQLYQISQLNHGLMMVGPSGSGKSTAWRVLLKALERHEGVEGVAHVIDPKAMSKEALYGVLDPNTREWTDGLFTHILRWVVVHSGKRNLVEK